MRPGGAERTPGRTQAPALTLGPASWASCGQGRHTGSGNFLAGNPVAAEGANCRSYADPAGFPQCTAAPAPPFLLRRREFRLPGSGTVHPSVPSAQWLGILCNPRFPVAYTPVAVTVYWQPRGAKAPRGRELGRDMQRTGNPGETSGWGGSRAPPLYPSP